VSLGITMAERKELHLVAVLLTTVFCAGNATAQSNGSSFTNAAQSAVDYRAAPSRPVMPCRDVLALTDFDNSIVSADLDLADGAVSGTCIVRGVISPEIQYLVHLPGSWNQRLYMHYTIHCYRGYQDAPQDHPHC